MIICRIGNDSDVHLSGGKLGWWCSGCSLGSKSGIASAASAKYHLLTHERAGDRVPIEALEKIDTLIESKSEDHNAKSIPMAKDPV